MLMKRKDYESQENLNTLIGVKTIFEGNIIADGSVKIEGSLSGDLKANGDVFIGENAEVRGNISGNNIYVSGMVDGNVKAKGLLKLMSTAKIYGDIEIRSFVSDEGGIFQGKCNMIVSSESDNDNTQRKFLSPQKDIKKLNIINEISEEKSKEV